jgi:hypothetical protein
MKPYDHGYTAGWSGKYAHQNPHLASGQDASEADTPEAQEWERGRFDGRRDKRDNR